MPITAEDIIEIIASEAGLAPDKLRPEATLSELDISSLDLASIIFTVEDKLGIEIQPEDFSRDLSVAGFVDQIRALSPL